MIACTSAVIASTNQASAEAGSSDSNGRIASERCGIGASRNSRPTAPAANTSASAARAASQARRRRVPTPRGATPAAAATSSPGGPEPVLGGKAAPTAADGLPAGWASSK